MQSLIAESQRKRRTSPVALATPRNVNRTINQGAVKGPATKTTEPPGKIAQPGAERVFFQRLFPQAEHVSLAGSFNNWQPSAAPLKNIGGGRWALELMLKPGRYEYRFIIDGNWSDDPLGHTFVANPFGTRNCVLLVGASATATKENPPLSSRT